MTLGPQTQAVLLLTARFGKPGPTEPRPLSPTEWGRFALWLHERGLRPEDLLEADPTGRLDGFSDQSIGPERVGFLLGRGAALGLASERWARAGIWVLTRGDTAYPSRLKKHFQNATPPVLFGCGKRELLDKGGLAVVGSRNATAEELGFATELGRTAAAQGHSIVSGGARGIDEAAMLGALDREGTVVGVLADDLLKSATSARFRQGLLAKNLVLVSPFGPETGFEVGNAMGRNKYIYALAEAAVVVTSTEGKGGTWAGALEDLKHRWVPLWVRRTGDTPPGNAALLGRGARPLPDGELDLAALFAASSEAPANAAPVASPSTGERTPRTVALAPAQVELDLRPRAVAPKPEAPPRPPPTEAPPPDSFYAFFLSRLRALTADGPLTEAALLAALELTKPQLTTWLKRAVTEGHAARLARPVRYRAT
ncbi:MAG: DNA-protecting protein DprA [Deltaproteobacteria bacterium]|nr:DNA-protecting protein DprA [Deltaproteobacteria bacterium]